MADQRIFFKQGSTTTGDSGERGDSPAAGGGFNSIKPITDGERAAQAILRRPDENVRQRTERLRDAGEESKYLIDSGMRWILAAGNAEGLSPGPMAMPGITGWDPSPGAGSFVATAPLVVQPITTPSVDIQEAAIYGFPYAGSPPAERVTFTPISIADPPSDVDALTNKRAYNGANLIKIIWEAKTSSELSGATVPGYCDAVLSGDPVHVLTISILDTGATQLAQLETALDALATRSGLIGDIGLQYVVGGSLSQAMDIADISSDAKGVDYRMVGTFERELHYIPTATFVDFFAAPNELLDGDTLAIQFADYTTDAVAADPLTGRRERVPSNNSTTYPNNTSVLAADLFITSTPLDVYKIPLCVPICKRIGDDLYWLDGTVITSGQSGEPIYMGEHGYTVNRIVGAATTVLMNVYVDPTTPLSEDPMALTNTSIQDNMENITRFVNTKGSMYADETITGAWTFAPPLSTGTPSADLFGEAIVSTLDGIAITGDYAGLANILALSAGSVSGVIYGSYNDMTFSGGAVSQVNGTYNLITVEAAGSISSYIRGVYGKVTVAAGATVGNHIYGGNFIVNNDADLSGPDTLYATELYLSNDGDLDSGNVYGLNNRVLSTGTLTSGDLCAHRAYIDNNGGVLTGGDLYGHYAHVLNGGTLGSGHIYGSRVVVDNNGGTLTNGDIYGLHLSFPNLGTVVGGDTYAFYCDDDVRSHHAGNWHVGVGAGPSGHENIRLGVGGAIATWGTGYDTWNHTAATSLERDVEGKSVLSVSFSGSAVSGSGISGLSGGTVGQWLVITNRGPNWFNLVPGTGTQAFLVPDLVPIPAEGGVLCLCDGSDWHVMSAFGQQPMVGTGVVDNGQDTIDARGLAVLNVTSVGAPAHNVLKTLSNPRPNQQLLIVNEDATNDIQLTVTGGNILSILLIESKAARLMVYNSTLGKWIATKATEV